MVTSAVETKERLARAFAETLWDDKKLTGERGEKRIAHANTLIDNLMEHHELVAQYMHEVGLYDSY